MTHAVLCAFARTPFTPAYKGALASVRPDDLMAQLVQGLLKKLPLRQEDIEDMVLGCAFPEAEQGFNMARQVVMLAGLPDSVAGVTLNRFCGSSMEAIHLAAGKIAIGAGELFLVGGVESMSRVPMTGFNPLPNPTLYKARKEAYMSMGLTAEHVAASCNITRAAQEAFAVESHRKAAAANMQEEIIPIATKAGIVDHDGCIRAESSVDALATLNPAFTQGGTVTAGTSSPLTDGAALVVVASLDYAKKHNLPILARIHSHAVVGVAPESMGLGPVAATHKLLQRAGLSIKDIDVAEINEAFAAQALPCIAQLALDATKVNIEGGAIALGHPLGASGARITGKAALLLHRSGGRYALSAQCIGGGQGIATLLEKVGA